jgi:hypothetical protein
LRAAAPCCTPAAPLLHPGTRAPAAAPQPRPAAALGPAARGGAAGPEPRPPPDPGAATPRACARAGLQVHHFDLYRLAGPAEMARLNLDDSFSGAISLVEWAERLQQQVPAERLGLHLTILPEVGRGLWLCRLWVCRLCRLWLWLCRLRLCRLWLCRLRLCRLRLCRLWLCRPRPCRLWLCRLRPCRLRPCRPCLCRLLVGAQRAQGDGSALQASAQSSPRGAGASALAALQAVLALPASAQDERQRLLQQHPQLQQAAAAAAAAEAQAAARQRGQLDAGAEQEEEEEEEEEELYTDRRWRRLELQGVGRRWQQLVQLVGAELERRPGAAGGRPEPAAQRHNALAALCSEPCCCRCCPSAGLCRLPAGAPS